MTEGPQKDHLNQLGHTNDPKEFMQGFLASETYQEVYDKFMEGKNPDPDVTEDEKRQVFLEQEAAKSAIVDYGHNEVRLHYKPESYPPASRSAIDIYISSTARILTKMQEYNDPDNIRNLDALRSIYHQTAADQLVKDGIVPTSKIGRSLVKLLLIDRGYDTFSNAKTPDIERVRRLITPD